MVLPFDEDADNITLVLPSCNYSKHEVLFKSHNEYNHITIDSLFNTKFLHHYLTLVRLMAVCFTLKHKHIQQ